MCHLKYVPAGGMVYTIAHLVVELGEIDPSKVFTGSTRNLCRHLQGYCYSYRVHPCNSFERQLLACRLRIEFIVACLRQGPRRYLASDQFRIVQC